MAYDHALAQRIRTALARRKGVTEKEMFGGIAFLLDGKMFCGVLKDELIVRVGPEAHAGALAEKHVRPMDFTGRPMRGYVLVGPAGLRGDGTLSGWIERARSFVEESVLARPATARARPPPRSRRRTAPSARKPRPPTR